MCAHKRFLLNLFILNSSLALLAKNVLSNYHPTDSHRAALMNVNTSISHQPLVGMFLNTSIHTSDHRRGFVAQCVGVGQRVEEPRGVEPRINPE